jgi:hypothetical protein
MKILPANALSRLAEHERGYFHVSVPNDTLAEDVLKPGYWANHTGRLKPGYLVDIVTSDLQLDMQLRCIKVEPGMVHMRLRFGYESNDRKAALELAKQAADGNAQAAEAIAVPDGYKVGHVPKLGFYVKLQATGETLAQGLESMLAAKKFAQEHAAKAQKLAA